MNSKVMIVLAALMLVGAVIAGYLGYKASAQPAKPVEVAVPKVALGTDPTRPVSQDGRYAVVVTAHDLPALATLTANDVYVDYLRQVPPGSYGRIEAVVGKKVWVNVPAGTVLGEASLQQGGQLSKLIMPGERAVAVGVDEVVGGGGLIRPGDFVDVLLYTKDDSTVVGRKTDAAQVVLPGVRVLSYGPRVALTNAPNPQDKTDEQQKAADNSTARTAVLSLAEPDVPKLLLASNIGTLRLAVRNPDEALPAPGMKNGKPAPMELSDDVRRLILSSALLPNKVGGPAPVALPRAPAHVHAEKAVLRAPVEEKSSITVYRGRDVQQVTP